MSDMLEYICQGAHCKCMDKDCPKYHNGDHTCPYSTKSGVEPLPGVAGEEKHGDSNSRSESA